MKKLINATQKADVIKSFNKTQFDEIASRCLPCHALLSMTPQFYLDNEALNMAAIDSLTGVISQVHGWGGVSIIHEPTRNNPQ